MPGSFLEYQFHPCSKAVRQAIETMSHEERGKFGRGCSNGVLKGKAAVKDLPVTLGIQEESLMVNARVGWTEISRTELQGIVAGCSPVPLNYIGGGCQQNQPGQLPRKPLQPAKPEPLCLRRKRPGKQQRPRRRQEESKEGQCKESCQSRQKGSQESRQACAEDNQEKHAGKNNCQQKENDLKEDNPKQETDTDQEADKHLDPEQSQEPLQQGEKAIAKKVETAKEKAKRLKKSISCKAGKAANKIKGIDKKITKTLSNTKGKNAAIRFVQGAAGNLYKQGKGLGKTVFSSLARGQSPLQGILWDSAKGMADMARHPASAAKGIKDYYSTMVKEKGWAYTAGDVSTYIAEAIAMRKATKAPTKNQQKITRTNLGNFIDTTKAKNHVTSNGNPGTRGMPNSSVDILDKYGNVKTRRWYDSTGKVYRDVDMTNHGNPKTHPEYPHEHLWDWTNGKAKRL